MKLDDMIIILNNIKDKVDCIESELREMRISLSSAFDYVICKLKEEIERKQDNDKFAKDLSEFRNEGKKEEKRTFVEPKRFWVLKSVHTGELYSCRDSYFECFHSSDLALKRLIEMQELGLLLKYTYAVVRIEINEVKNDNTNI
jgi:hypothetical protein